MPREKLPALGSKSKAPAKPASQPAEKKGLSFPRIAISDAARTAAGKRIADSEPNADGADIFEALHSVLGAVEVVPIDPCAPDCAERVRITAVGPRLDWSRVEAYRLAVSALRHREMLQEWNAEAKRRGLKNARGGGQIVSVPRESMVVLCPRCYSLQLATSKRDRRWECSICPLSCPKFADHKANQKSCKQCSVEMVEVWSSSSEIPDEWRVIADGAEEGSENLDREGIHSEGEEEGPEGGLALRSPSKGDDGSAAGRRALDDSGGSREAGLPPGKARPKLPALGDRLR